MSKNKISRRDFLKLSGAGLSTLALGMYGNSLIGKANSKDVTNEIPKASQKDFIDVNRATLGELDGDEIKELIMAYNRDDGSSLVKFYPVGEEGPFDVRYDFDRPGMRIAGPINSLSVSARQKDKESVAFGMNLAGDLSLSEEIRERAPPVEDLVEYKWLIDSDKNPETGKKMKYIGAEYQIGLKGNGKNWEAYVNRVKLSEDDFKVSGNEIEVTVPIKYLDHPKSFNYGSMTYGLSMVGKGFPNDRFPDWIGPPKKPGTLTIDPNFEGSEEDFSRIYKLPSQVEEMDIEEINGKPTAVVNTKEGEYLFCWNSEEKEFEIEKG